MGASPLSPQLLCRGGGLETCAGGGWKHRLGLCLYPTHWGPISCAPIGWGTHQCHDGWCTQCGNLGLAPPDADMQTIITRGHSGMLGMFEQQTWRLVVYLPGAATLECCCPWQTYPWTITDRSGPRQHAAWEHFNQHSGSHYCTGTTPSLANTMELPSNIAMAINLQFQGPWNRCSSLSPQPQLLSPIAAHWGETAISGTGGSTHNKRNRISPLARGDGLSHPCPGGNPYADVSLGGHIRQHPQLHLCD